jgi:hypothetical protein
MVPRLVLFRPSVSSPGLKIKRRYRHGIHGGVIGSRGMAAAAGFLGALRHAASSFRAC